MEEKKKKETKGYFCYYELLTEYGPFYIYEEYQNDPSNVDAFRREMPVTKEFLTGEEAIRGYHTLDFLNRTARFKTEEMSMDGEPLDYYLKPLQPWEFLMKIGAYLEDKEAKAIKASQIKYSMKCKAEGIGNTNVIKRELEVTDEQRNKVASLMLRRFVG